MSEPSSESELTSADLERIAALVDDLAETSAALVELGDEQDVPAIEHTASRVRDSVRVLEQNVPQELLEE